MRVLGIDPGMNGALALFDTTQDRLWIEDMPTVSYANKTGRKRRELSEAQLVLMVQNMRAEAALVEAVHAMPKQGVSSTFVFGMNFGIVRGVLAACAVPTQFVTPREWKRMFGLGADKAQARLVAARVFPAQADLFSRRMDDGRAEAALLARYAANGSVRE